MPTLDRTKYAAAAGLRQGAYVLADAPGGDPEVILLSTGTEVPLCIDAFEQLTADGVRARVVSMPSWNLFERQPREYRDEVIPPHVTARVGVEQASDLRMGPLCRQRGPDDRHEHVRQPPHRSRTFSGSSASRPSGSWKLPKNC